jgi:hypothetical protein
MDAVCFGSLFLAGKRFVKNMSSCSINFYFIGQYKTPQQHPLSTPSDGRACFKAGISIKSTP